MNVIHRNTLLLVLVTIGVIAMTISVVAYSWLFIKVHNTITEVVFASEEVQLLATKNAHTQTVRRVVRDTQLERDEINSYFVTDEGLVSFLEDIEELGVHAGAPISVQSVSVGDTIDKDELVAPLELLLKSEGTLPEVFYMLALLEAFPKVITVDSVRFTQLPNTLEWQGEFDVIVIKIASKDNK